jgi:hypothetical protein
MNLIEEEQLLLKDIFKVRVRPTESGYVLAEAGTRWWS